MKFLKSKLFLICVALVAAVIVVTALFAAFGITGPVRSALQTVAKPFEWCGAKVAAALNGFVSTFRDYDRIAAENEALRAALDSMAEESYGADLLKEENEWLKDYLRLAEDHPEFALTDARIIAREAGNYATVLTLDRGRVHGIKEKMPVLTEDGVYGYVKEVGLDWCRVVSILETATSVGAYTDRGGALGVVEGDAALRGEGKCRMTYIEYTADIRVGDRVYTAGGVGSLYPSGLLIGEVVSIEADESRNLVAIIAPAADFSEQDGASRMMIVSGYAEGS